MNNSLKKPKMFSLNSLLQIIFIHYLANVYSLGFASLHLLDYDILQSAINNTGQSQPEITCLHGQFQCRYSNECIPMGWLCDGENDCGVISPLTINNQSNQESLSFLDTSDEDQQRCQPKNECAQNYFRCANLITCIKLSQVCNNVTDCPDQSDEANFCENNKLCEQLNCEYGCKPLPKGAECFCPNDYAYNGTKCVRLNKCLYEEQCDQQCQNENDHFRCICIKGYKIFNDSKCIAINEPETYPLMVALNFGNEIQLIHPQLQEKQYSIIFNENNHLKKSEKKISSFAFSFTNSQICYLTKIINLDEDLHRFDFKNIYKNETFNQIICNTWNSSMNSSSQKLFHIQSPFYSSMFVRSFVHDWIGNNWYFLDVINEIIFVCNSLFQHCSSVVDTGLNKPKMLVLDPINGGYIFTIEWGPNAFLKRFQMDGSNGKILIQERIVYPNLISLDLANQQVKL